MAGCTRSIDTCFVDDRCFTVMAGMGLDAEMVRSTSETSKRRFGWLAYVGSALSALFERRLRLTIQLDDQPKFNRRARSVLIGNAGELPGGARLMRAEPDDGQLSVAVISARTVFDWLSLLWGTVRRQSRVPYVDVYRAKRVHIESRYVVARQLDGDLLPPGKTMRARIQPTAVQVCVLAAREVPDPRHPER
jgi:diacylglycerol kinase family enzyme